MLDHDLRSLRDDIDAQVPIPPFDSLVSRSRQRRRRTGAGIAVLALLAGGIAIGAGEVVQQDARPPATTEPNVPPRTADELIDSKGADLWWFDHPERGFEYAVWGNGCDDENCPLAVTWSTDGWATRESYLLPTWGDVWWTGQNFLVYQEEAIAYLLNTDSTRVAISAPTSARPAESAEYVIGDEHLGDVLLDPRTGRTHHILVPKDIDVHQVSTNDDGSMSLLGALQDGSFVFATSTDGGATWARHDEPVKPEGSWFYKHGANVMISRQGLEGVELTVSPDSGATWLAVDHLPFAHADCYTTAGDLLFLNNGTQLYRSTDRSWTEFEEVAEAPPLQCPSATNDTLAATGADRKSGLIGGDLGDSWIVLEPR